MKEENIEQIVDEIKNIIVSKLNPEKIILFGSCVRDTDYKNDIDLFIVHESNLRMDIRGQEIRQKLPYKYPIDVVVYTPEEYQKYKNVKNGFLHGILKTGKIIYERK